MPAKVYLLHKIWDQGYGGEVFGATLDKRLAQETVNKYGARDKKNRAQSSWYAFEEMSLMEAPEQVKEEILKRYGDEAIWGELPKC